MAQLSPWTNEFIPRWLAVRQKVYEQMNDPTWMLHCEARRVTERRKPTDVRGLAELLLSGDVTSQDDFSIVARAVVDWLRSFRPRDADGRWVKVVYAA